MLVLHQFLASHYNEKVRWALDYKRLPHRRETYLPGPHIPLIRSLSGGPSSTPLLQHGDGCVSGSAAIIAWLEQYHPQPALFPAQGPARERSLELQQRFDRELGPAARAAVFSALLANTAYLAATFSHTKPAWKRLAYRAVLPALKPLVRKGNAVYPANVSRSIDLVSRSLDELGRLSSESPYLAGERFSVADLTAAALLAPLARVDHPDMRWIEPLPEALQDLLARWRDHPALEWVASIYRRHRPRADHAAELAREDAD